MIAFKQWIGWVLGLVSVVVHTIAKHVSMHTNSTTCVDAIIIVIYNLKSIVRIFTPLILFLNVIVQLHKLISNTNTNKFSCNRQAYYIIVSPQPFPLPQVI